RKTATVSFANITGKVMIEQKDTTSTSRIAGVCAITFALGVIAANFFLSGNPRPETPLVEVMEWYAANTNNLMLASGLVGITFPALVVFSAMMYMLSKANDAAHRWMLIGSL